MPQTTYATNVYTGDGSTVLFPFTFEINNRSLLRIYLDDIITSQYTIVTNPNAIRFNAAPAVGVEVKIIRDTEVSSPVTVLDFGIVNQAQGFNNATNQLLWSIQELWDYAQEAHQDIVDIFANLKIIDAEIVQIKKDIAYLMGMEIKIDEILARLQTVEQAIVRMNTDIEQFRITLRAIESKTAQLEVDVNEILVRLSAAESNVTVLNSRTQQATDTSKGIVQLADFNTVALGVDDTKAITSKSVRGYIPPLSSFFVTGRSVDNHRYVRTNMSANEARMDIYGRIVVDTATPIRVNMPNKLLESDMTALANIDTHTTGAIGGEVAILNTDGSFVDFVILNSSGNIIPGAFFFYISGDLDMSLMPPTPTNVQSRAVGSTVTLTWD